MYEISKDKEIQESWSSDIGDIGNGSPGRDPHEAKQPDERDDLFGQGNNRLIQIIIIV